MAKLSVHDLTRNTLAFDLRDLVRVLAPASLAAMWTIKAPEEVAFEATGAGGLRLAELAEVSARITGQELQNIANATTQVIWGNFIGVLPDEPDRTWLVIRAIDSSFYEIETADTAAVEKVKSHFTDVRNAEQAC